MASLIELLAKARSYFVVDDDVLSVEQPFTYEYGKDRMVLIDFIGTFVMPASHFESMDVWTHEFIEKTIIKKMRNMEEATNLCICFDDRCVTVFHLLSGLTTGSGWDDEDLTPDMLWEVLHDPA